MTSILPTRYLGPEKLAVSSFGFGAMALSGVYEPVDEAEAIKTIHCALDCGIRLIDTADFYTKGQRTADAEWGHNEKLVGRAIQGRRDQIVLATKVGATIKPDGSIGPNGTPDYIKSSVDGSLYRLGVDVIDIYYLHRVDPNVPIEDSVGALADLVKSGKIKHIGLSEASARNIRKAHGVHPITAIQSEYSLVTRDPEAEVLPTCRELGIGFVPFASLGRGMLTGAIHRPEDMAKTDWRRSAAPRFQPGNLEHNIELIDKLGDIAVGLGLTIPQIALSWLLHQAEFIVPLFGAVTPEVVKMNLENASAELSPGVLNEIDELFHPGAVKGDRYPGNFMKAIDR